MKVLLVGSGGREHALAWKILQSPLLTKLYVAPGNAGILAPAECVNIAADDLQGLLDFAKKESIDLTVVGPEAPLVEGITDLFEKEGLKVFGPSQEGARLEGSKTFSKDLMNQCGVPTADYHVFTNINEAKQYAIEAEMPVVVKADGLAAGKGVFICETAQDAVNAITRMMSDGVFGEAGNQIVIETLLDGEEISILALTDGKTVVPLASSQDHKRAYDHDRGPNTGGMGAYSPCPAMPDDQMEEAVNMTVRPMIEGMASRGISYRGILYAGLMMTDKGPFVLEYNCRFGDPETQAVLPRLKTDLLKLMVEVAEGNLQTTDLEWDERACLSVVVASGGYPGAYHKDFSIQGLHLFEGDRDAVVFHAGTRLNEENKIVTSGGRVLAVSALGSSLREACDEAYKRVAQISFQDAFYRRDIGRRALEVHR